MAERLRSDHRDAVGHGFEDRHSETFVERRKGEDAGARVEGCELFAGQVAEDVDVGAPRAFFHCAQFFGRAVALRGTGQREAPARRETLKGLHQAAHVLAPLDDTDEQDQVFAACDADGRNLRRPMGHDVNARWLDAQKLLHLRGGELRHGDDGVAVGGRLAGLLREARAKLG